MSGKPNCEREYTALAKQMAASGIFSDARSVRQLMEQWPLETTQWWTPELRRELERLIPSGARIPRKPASHMTDRALALLRAQQVMVIESDACTRSLIRNALLLAGVTATATAEHPGEAAEKMATSPSSLIIARWDGSPKTRDALAHLRTLDAPYGAMRMVLTCDGTKRAHRAALRWADGVVDQPFTQHDLLNRLCMVLTQEQDAEAPSLRS